MLPVLYCSGEFRHVPVRERRKAAWEAQQRAMRHWQLWFAITLVMIATVLGSLIAQHFLKSDRDGTVGAALGFILGTMWYARTLFRIGMPYYRQILSAREKADTQNPRQ